MNLCGLTDSLATLAASPNECPHCHTTSRIAHGLCLACLLHSGEEEADNNNRLADFEAALDAVAVADTHWRLGNYEILEEIGRGGMGVIYRARQRHSRRIVALKRILSYHADSRETLARFRREAEAAASLDHPNILPIYEVGESEEGVPYFSMKYASGGSLQEVGPALRSDPREVVRLLAKVTRAVQYAHRQGILHRDLKPGNILLDGRGEPLVSDFGLAKWLDTTSDLTRTLTIFGTPGYIAPEQAEGPAASLRPSADIYSLGAILFDLLAGRPPFLGEHALAVIRQASEKAAPKLRSLVKGADKDLETICARCLEREPAARYHSAGDLAEDLERWLEGRSIIARPLSPLIRSWRWTKRNPKLAVSIGACVIFAATALLWRMQNRQLGEVVRKNESAANSVAVLPFIDLDSGEANVEFEKKIADSLRVSLSGLAPSQVIVLGADESWGAGTGDRQDMENASRSSRSRLLLTGSTRRRGANTRIALRLVDVANGRIIWRKLLHGRAVETSWATAIREITAAMLGYSSPAPFGLADSDDPAMHNQSAREFIISARQLMLRLSVGDFDRAIECLQRALKLEPHSGLGHAYLAIALAGRTHFQPDPRLIAQAETAARTAVQLEPDSATSHRALAGVFYQQRKLSDALEEQLHAVEAEGVEERSAAAIGDILLKLGRPTRALAWFRMAKHWATLPGDYDSDIGDCWTVLGEDQRAEKSYRRCMDLRPESPDGWMGLSHLRLLQHDFAGARALLVENAARFHSYNDSDHDPDLLRAQIEFYARNYSEADRVYSKLAQKNSADSTAFYGAVSCVSASGRLKQLQGDVQEARVMLTPLLETQLRNEASEQNPAMLYELAAVEASLDEKTAAFASLHKAIATGWLDARGMQLDPRFDSLATDPRFQDCLRDMHVMIDKLREETSLDSIVVDK